VRGHRSTACAVRSRAQEPPAPPEPDTAQRSGEGHQGRRPPHGAPEAARPAGWNPRREEITTSSPARLGADRRSRGSLSSSLIRTRPRGFMHPDRSPAGPRSEPDRARANDRIRDWKACWGHPSRVRISHPPPSLDGNRRASLTRAGAAFRSPSPFLSQLTHRILVAGPTRPATSRCTGSVMCCTRCLTQRLTARSASPSAMAPQTATGRRPPH
jgi:hypothetical protein